MVYTTNWDYSKRRFDVVPAGFMATTEHHSIVSGVLDVATGIFIRTGLGVIQKDFGTSGSNIRRFVLPSAAGDSAKFVGILLFDNSNYRFPGQPKLTHTKDDMVNVAREGEVRVVTTEAIPVGAQVYCIHTTNGAEQPGMFKASASANAFLVKNAKWGEVTTSAGVATLELKNDIN